MPMDNNDDDDDNDDNDDNDDDDDDDNDDDGDGDGDGNGDSDEDNNNSTIKQCTGVRKRRKTPAMDDGQQQKWRLLRRNSARGIKEEERMTIDNS